jgi:CheY-like chemotaxis protein
MISQTLPRVVALVGFRRGVPVRGRGILERSGLSPIQFESADRALWALQKSLQVDAIILDGSCAVDSQDVETVEELLSFAGSPPWAEYPVPVIFLTSSQSPARLRRSYKQQGVHLIGRDRLRYRQVSRLILALCGVEQRVFTRVA